MVCPHTMVSSWPMFGIEHMLLILEVYFFRHVDNLPSPHGYLKFLGILPLTSSKSSTSSASKSRKVIFIGVFGAAIKVTSRGLHARTPMVPPLLQCCRMGRPKFPTDWLNQLDLS